MGGNERGWTRAHRSTLRPGCAGPVARLRPDRKWRRSDASRARPRVVLAKLRIPRNGGLVRDRLLASLEDVWSCGICLIVAPAGCGKTTLLCQFASASPLPVAWYRADAGDGDPEVFLAHLEASARGALGAPAGQWLCAADASLALEQSVEHGLLLVIDDLQALHGSPAESELERLLEYLPDRVAVVAASR